MKDIKNIIFDFDGTLANTLPFVERVVEDIAPKYGITNITPKMISEAKNLNIEEILEKYDVSKLNFLKFSFIYRRRLNSEIGEVQTFEGISEVLEELKNKGYNLGIITSNSKSNVRKFLTKNKFEKHFDFVANRIFFFSKYKTIEKWIKKLSWKKDETVYIGDEIRDIEEARKAGIKVISVSWGLNEKKGLYEAGPDELIDEPSQLLLIL